MVVLQEIAKLLNEERLRHRDLSLDPWSSGDKVGEYFRALLADSFENEDEAAFRFYGSDRKSTAYQKLKAKLKRILLGRLFLLDFQKSEETDRRRAYMECHRNWAAIKILIGKNKRQAAVRTAKQLLRLSQKYEFTELTVDLLRFLRAHYGVQEGNQQVYEHYKELFSQYAETLQLEDWAEELYTDVANQYAYKKALGEEALDKAEDAYKQLAPVLRRNTSYRLRVSGTLLGLVVYSGRNDYPTTIGFCEKEITFFKAKNYQANLPLQLLYQQLVVCYTQLRQYDRAGQAAEEGLNYLVVGSFNWFKHQEQRFLLYMHTEQYQAAYELWEQTTGERSFRRAPEQLTEMWLVFQAYLYYLASIGELVISHEMQEAFRLGRFINQTPRYSKDKKGMNIPILIIQILFMIDQNRHNEVIDRIEAIEKYCSRYLKKGDMLRSNCFIKMLLQIPIAHFHRAAVIRKADKYWQRLQANPIDLSHQAHEIEIIPYEKLWGYVLDRLNEKFFRPRKKKNTRKATIERVGGR